MAKPKMTDNDIAAVVAAAVLGERERCAKLIPTNWCDPLLTGKDAPKEFDCPSVEKLLRGIQARIRGDR